MAACNENEKCVAFDLGDDGSCWIHEDELPILDTRTDVTHYIKKEVCPGRLFYGISFWVLQNYSADQYYVDMVFTFYLYLL